MARLRSYNERYIALAKRAGIGFILEGPTWRANPDWAAKLGYSREALAKRQPRRGRDDGGAARASTRRRKRRS